MIRTDHHRRVLKWDVPVDDQTHEIGGGPVRFVACQHHPQIVQIWTEEFTYDPVVKRSVRVHGTGHDVLPAEEYLGTALAAEGRLVWHVFEAKA